MKLFHNIKGVFNILSDKDAYFENIGNKSNKVLIYQLITISILAFLIGVVMGSYHSLGQSISSGIKLIALQISVMIICFPSFFIIQRVLGSKMTFTQMAMIIMSGLVLTLSIVLSFTPIVVFFMLIGSKYHFIQLLHVLIFVFGGFWGLRLMVDSLKFACDEKKIYPKTGVSVFRVWIIVLAFVSIQLSWNLRPFVGEKQDDFEVLGDYKGNFYTAVMYSINQLGSGDDDNERDYLPPQNRSFEQETANDSVYIEELEPLDGN